MMTRAFLMACYLLSSLPIFFCPSFTQREILFGVVVPEGFRSSLEGRSALRAFRIRIVLSAAAAVLALAVAPNSVLVPATLFGPLFTTMVAITTSVTLNRQLKPHAVTLSPIRHLELSDKPEPLPWLVWTGILPVALLAAAAIYLNAHWEAIPLRYPVHFDISGNPNRWNDRSVRHVYGPLVLGGELALWFFTLSLASWYGCRRSEPMRKPMVVINSVASCVLGLLFVGIALQPVTGIRAAPFLIIGLPALIAAIVYAVRLSNEPSAAMDPTPAECWRGGIGYYNPDDAAILVGRRDGVGLTPNFANPWSWLLMGSLLFVVTVSSIWLLR